MDAHTAALPNTAPDDPRREEERQRLQSQVDTLNADIEALREAGRLWAVTVGYSGLELIEAHDADWSSLHHHISEQIEGALDYSYAQGPACLVLQMMEGMGVSDQDEAADLFCDWAEEAAREYLEQAPEGWPELSEEVQGRLLRIAGKGGANG